MADQYNDKLRRFARVLLDQPDSEACQRCLDLLEAYCAAQLAGADAAAQFPEVAFHLDTCIACAESYAVLYETLLAPARLAEPAHYPTPDLRFLPKIAEQSRTAPNLRELLALAIQRSGRSVRLQLSQVLLDLLPPPGSPTTLAFRSAGQAVPLFELHVREPDALIAELLVSAMGQIDPVYCDLRVQVTIRGQSWPDLEGIVVQLHQGELRQQAISDAWGEVLFRNVERANLSTMELTFETPEPGVADSR